jgi:hypothetical protein
MLQERLERLGKLPVLVCGSLTQVFGELAGDVARPAFGEVEADDPTRAFVLAAQKVRDDRFVIGGLGGLALVAKLSWIIA